MRFCSPYCADEETAAGTGPRSRRPQASSHEHRALQPANLTQRGPEDGGTVRKQNQPGVQPSGHNFTAFYLPIQAFSGEEPRGAGMGTLLGNRRKLTRRRRGTESKAGRSQPAARWLVPPKLPTNHGTAGTVLGLAGDRGNHTRFRSASGAPWGVRTPELH